MAASKSRDDSYPLPEKFTPGLIGIVTVTYNSGLVLPGFIRSITLQSHTHFILYAIDNDSQDDTLPQLRNWAKRRSPCGSGAGSGGFTPRSGAAAAASSQSGSSATPRYCVSSEKVCFQLPGADAAALS